jgi:uncharacterized membrane protein
MNHDKPFLRRNKLPMRYILFALIAAGLGLSQVACGTKKDPVNEGNASAGESSLSDAGPSEVTYTERVKALLDDNCNKCHSSAVQGASREGAPVGLDFDTYSLAKTNGKRANREIQSGAMPPTDPLSRNDKELFQAWVDQGFKE